MNEDILIKNNLLKNFHQYIYLSLFFLLSAFFVFFVIRPNLREIVSAKQKLEELQHVNSRFNQLNDKIMSFQGDFEQYRGDLVFIDQTITNSVEVNKVISDVQNAVKKSNLMIDSMSVNNIDLKYENKDKKTKIIQIDLSLSGSFPDFYNFIKEIHRQRRIKIFDGITIEKETIASPIEASQSGGLKIKLKVDSFYL
jgi:Tfp pilus assembly protein PilO